MWRRGLGANRTSRHPDNMKGVKITSWLICCCLLLALSGCGNKGPLVLPEEEEEKKQVKSETG